MAEHYVKLKMCSGEGNSGRHNDQETAINAMKVSIVWRQKNLGETWSKVTNTKWASTNGHTMEVLPYE
jgi:hypothetical protein